MRYDAVHWAMDFRAKDLSEKAILLVLAGRADEFGYCWPSQATIAVQACGSLRKVKYVLAELQHRGVIQRRGRWRGNGSRQSDAILLVAFPDRLPLPDTGHPTLEFGEDHQPKGTPCPVQSAGCASHIVQDVPNGDARCAHLELLSESRKETTTTSNPDLELCLSVLGPAVDAEARAVVALTAAEIDRWLAGGCDLALDALPVIAARTAKARSSPILTFAYFTPAVFEAAARRRASANSTKEDCNEPAARTARPAYSRRSVADALKRGWSIAAAKADRP